MPHVTFEEVYANAYVAESVNAIMAGLVRQYPLLLSYRDDIRQQLWLILNRQLPQFNPEKCSVETYARMTLDSAVREARRGYFSARNLEKNAVFYFSCRLECESSPEEFFTDFEYERAKFHAMVREAVATLSPIRQRICAMFADGAAYPDIKRELHISYKTLVNVHIPAIRTAFRENIF